MLVSLKKMTFRDEFDRILMFFALHSVLFLCAKIYEFIRYEFTLVSFIILILWFVFYRFFYRVLKFLYYTYWSMTAVSFIVMFYSMVAAAQIYSDLSLFYFYFFGIVTLAMTSYMLHSPIYYPIQNWWEYDFRYRNDVRTFIKVEDGELEEARLIDLRRNSGGLASFKEMDVGEKLLIKPEYNELDKEFEVEIMSKRATTIGRPYVYGLKFHFNSEDSQKDFVIFQKYWQFERKYKSMAKFSR
jgi:hypothetical protein